MDRTQIIPVILSGGCGSRLWPMSRQDRPKQFLKLLDDQTLFQATLLRAMSVLGCDAGKVVTVTHKDLKPETISQMLEIDAALTDHILTEPNMRNTSAAVLYAALYVSRIFGLNSLMWVLPSDHHIGDESALVDALVEAKQYAHNGEMVTFGIKPDRPETDYGYISKGQNLENNHIYKVTQFLEKPCAEKASTLSKSPDFLWNSGIYLMQAKAVLAAYQEHAPDALKMLHYSLNECCCLKYPLTEFYALIKKEPFEKAILEKVKNVTVVETDPQWSDIGSWNGLWEASDKNIHGNVTRGRVICKDTTGSIIKSSSDKLITCVGVKDLVISDTGDAIMIAHKSSTGQLKHLVGTLQKMGNAEAMRPAESADGDIEYRMDTICVPPKKNYDVEPDERRGAVYIVVAGSADFTQDNECRTLKTGETTTVAAGERAIFSNSGPSDLKILQMHFGDFADDDHDPDTVSNTGFPLAS